MNRTRKTYETVKDAALFIFVMFTASVLVYAIGTLMEGLR